MHNSQFYVFTVKSPSVTQTSVSQENAFKKEQKPVGFSPQNYRLKNNSFTLGLVENNFRFSFFQIAKFELDVTVGLHYGLRQNAPSCKPLKKDNFLNVYDTLKIYRT